MMPEVTKTAALYEPDAALAVAYGQAAAAVGVQLRQVADPVADEAVQAGRDLLIIGGAEPLAHAEACRATSQQQARIIILLPAPSATSGQPEAERDQLPSLSLPLRLGALQHMMLQLAQRRPNVMLAGGWLLNAEARQLQQTAKAPVPLTEKEVSILLYLKLAARPVPREELLANVWGYHPDLTTHTVETHIYRLRQKLGADELLQTTEAGYVVL